MSRSRPYDPAASPISQAVARASQPQVQPAAASRLRYVLIGDGDSPHLLKWATALQPLVELWICSSRGFAPELARLVPQARRLALDTDPAHGGGNIALLKKAPQVARWLQQVDADWINPHYLTSHGTLALLAKRFGRLRGRLIASAWGSDILVTPQRHAAYSWLTRSILRSAALCTSDSQHMTGIMQQLGAREVLTFPFGLDSLPVLSRQPKQPWLCYANRGLEPIYQPQRVLELFAAIAAWQPQAQLLIANDGSLRPQLEQWVAQRGLQPQVRFVGRLSAQQQAEHYGRAQWYLSQPESDSVAVSVLEAMAYGCIPLLSDLPANRELVHDGHNGWIVPADAIDLDQAVPQALPALQARAADIARQNRDWVQQHGLFPPAIRQLVQTLSSR
ncbi:glycosyltransferase [Brachymonas sp. J145]|uniref:glycosyltransferase n=1 Tax=Brachymonas sp. J145 TaxID=3116489 RepID=UPI002E75F659|nr:glycosyltransferase [Brachymonas sp. J145]MEE1653392.1 glycosyltransferase [Brachymonas sp. J145]